MAFGFQRSDRQGLLEKVRGFAGSVFIKGKQPKVVQRAFVPGLKQEGFLVAGARGGAVSLGMPEIAEGKV